MRPALRPTRAEPPHSRLEVSGTLATFTGTPAAGTIYKINSIGGTALTNAAVYVAREGDTLGSVAKEMAARATFQAKSQGLDVDLSGDGTTGVVTMKNNTSATITGVATNAEQDQVIAATGTIGGGLEYLSKVNVTTTSGADAALGLVEELIQTSIKAAANFGSVQGRIETQSKFISQLTDSLKSGIGSLVDADMEEASARLQALQVQQQLGVQSLSIANQAPQSILSLFR